MGMIISRTHEGYVSELKDHYFKLVEKPFPLLVSDVLKIVRLDSYEKYCCGGLSYQEMINIRKEVESYAFR